MNTSNSTPVVAIEPITIGTGLGGQFASIKLNLEAKAEERNLTNAATSIFALRKPESFLRLAATFDQLEHVSVVKSLRSQVASLEKQVTKLTGDKDKMGVNLNGASKRAARVSQLERELVEQQEAFAGILQLLEVDPAELETMVAQMEAEFSQESALIVDAARKNRTSRSSVAKIAKITGKM